jgi:hypothetical protein
MELDASTVMLQWAVGGLAFCWVTTRHRIAGIGYGWLLRSVYLTIAALGVALGSVLGRDGSAAVGRDVAATCVALAAAGALVVSITRRTAEMSGRRTLRVERKRAIAAMAGGGRTEDGAPSDRATSGDGAPSDRATSEDGAPSDRATSEDGARSESGLRPVPSPEFPPGLDLIAPVLGLVGLAFAADDVGGPYALSLVRLVAGAAFLGAVTDAMLLGHWYLTQPGLPRSLLEEINRWVGYTWPVEVAALLWPTGMLQVFSGEVDDGWSGVLGYTWATCAITTIALVIVVRLALREKYYSAVMSATGLLYLAILTAFGTDLVARAVLSP